VVGLDGWAGWLGRVVGQGGWAGWLGWVVGLGGWAGWLGRVVGAEKGMYSICEASLTSFPVSRQRFVVRYQLVPPLFLSLL